MGWGWGLSSQYPRGQKAKKAKNPTETLAMQAMGARARDVAASKNNLPRHYFYRISLLNRSFSG